jgi:hypothetical protein
MMHRVLAVFDFTAAVEIHAPGFGGSAGLLISPGGALGFWKVPPQIMMGMLTPSPMGQSHDAGPLRVHVMVVPEPTTALSIALSAATTLLSSLKPLFTSHTVQAKVDSSYLPVCAEIIPYMMSLGSYSTMVCGSPCDLPNTMPIIPTQVSVWVGMTWGDLVGGIINGLADMAFSAVTSYAGDALKCGKGAWSTLSKTQIGSRILGHGMPWALKTGASSPIGLSTGPNNLGALAQQAIDGDGVTSDAPIALTFLGVGGQINQHSSSNGETASVSNTQFVAPWR